MSCNTATEPKLFKRFRTLTLILILGGILQAGCSDRSKGLLKKWEREVLAPKGSASLRKPASFKADVCLQDQDSVLALKEEIAQLEAQAGGAPIQGIWKHLDLSKLPRPQAAYLARFPQWVETQGYDASGCNDLPCVLNRIYGGAAEEEGLKVYLWYLRMGNVLSTLGRLPILPEGTWSLNREMPTELFQGTTLHDYLFSRDELTAFWMLSKTLSPLYRNMSSLQTIHRVPHGFKYPMSPRSCGFAWGAKTKGNVRLLDGCLELEGKPKSFEGFFYRGAPHELSHRLDDMLGDKKSLSESDEWRALSGWALEESADPQTGRTTSQWRSDPSKDGFVRDYTASNPAEDWADTSAYFRYEPETVLQKSPAKWNFVSRKIYGGRTFDTAGILAYYTEQVQKDLKQALPGIVDGCVAGKSPEEAAPHSGVDLHFDFSIDPQLMNCLKSSLASQIASSTNVLKLNEYEACDFFSKSAVGFNRQIIDRIMPDLSALIAKQSAIADQLRALSGLREDLKNSVDPREFFLKCFKAEDAVTCYLNAMTEAFAVSAKPFAGAIPAEALEAEKKAYLEGNSIETASAAAARLFGDLFVGVEPKVRHFARKRWETCHFAPDTGAAPKTRPFTGGAHYVSAGILDCINGAADSDLDALREAFSSKLGISVSDPNAQAFIRQLWLPLYMEVLDQHERSEAEAEDSEREQLRAGAVSFIQQQLKYSGSATPGVCFEQAARAFDAYVKDLPADRALQTRFAALEDLRVHWATEACENLAKSRVKPPAPKSPVAKPPVAKPPTKRVTPPRRRR